MNIAIMVFEQADMLDFGGPYEVFLTASRLAIRNGEDAPFDITTVSADGQSVTIYGGLKVLPEQALHNSPSVELLIVPGAIDIDAVLSDGTTVDCVKHFAKTQNSIIASVCTGAFLLAEAGLLDGLPWTTHWEDIQLLSDRVGSDGGQEKVRWVDNGQIITSAGLSSGISMALHLVHRFVSLELAHQVARQIDYSWSPDALQMP